MKSDYLVPVKINRWAEKWPLLAELIGSEYYQILESTFEKLDPSILYKSITHGRGHIERTMLYGALICMFESIPLEMAGDVVWCCALHDIGRSDDRYDEQHGERSAERLVKLGLDKCFSHPSEARAAIHAHSVPDNQMLSAPQFYGIEDSEVFRTLATCLKDADNLDRVRIYDFDAKFLRHDCTKTMVTLAYFVLNEFTRVPCVVCYGDSNTYGYNPVTGGRYPVFMRWPAALKEMLGPDYDVVAEGMNGRTACGAEYGNPSECFAVIDNILQSHYPVDRLVFMLGTNDCSSQYNLDASDIAAGMEKLILHAEKYLVELQGFMPEIILIAPKSMDEKALKGSFNKLVNEKSVEASKKLPELYSEIAEKHGCEFISLEDVLELSPVDGVHLQAFGGKKIAGKVSEIILGTASK